MKVKFTNIVWDTSNDDDDEFGDEAPPELPKEVTYDNIDDDTDLEDQGADILSDNFGFCVHSFDFEIVS